MLITGRKYDAFELEREKAEGCQAQLGVCLVYLNLIRERLQAAVSMGVEPRALTPALEDALRCMRLVRQVQKEIDCGFAAYSVRNS